MSDLDFLSRLQNAASDDERRWLVTERLLGTLPENLRQMAYAAAIPHWFDAEILAALRPDLKDQAEKLYADLQTLPFVEPFAGRGHNVHEVTRKLMLDFLWRENREEFITLSQRVEKYFSLLRPLEPHLQIEHIYHLLIVNEEKGADMARQIGWTWHNQGLGAWEFTSLRALVRTLREQATAREITGRSLGWITFFEGLLASYGYQPREAIEKFESVILANHQDKALNADTLQRLGDAHGGLFELSQARAHYEEALPLYRTIGEKLGEANCIQRLGDVHIGLSELPQARACYEEALPLYRTIGEKLGEANCIRALGDVHVGLSELPQARARYEKALSLYRTIGDKLGEANCILALGDVAAEGKDFSRAIQLCHEALTILRTISPGEEANGYNALAIVFNT